MQEQFSIGSKVRLRQDVDRFPFFIVRQGQTGVIEWFEEWDDRTVNVGVKMDEFIPGGETWDNEVHWLTTFDEFLEDVELI